MQGLLSVYRPSLGSITFESYRLNYNYFAQNVINYNELHQILIVID